MSYTKAWNYEGKNYIFKLTRKAQLEIEERYESKRRKIFENEQVVASFDKIENLELEREKIENMPEGKAKEKALKEFNAKYNELLKLMSVHSELTKEPFDLYELGYILIKAYPKNPSLTKDEYDILCSNIEDVLGLEETINMFVEMKEKVFQEMELINKILNKDTVPLM